MDKRYFFFLIIFVIIINILIYFLGKSGNGVIDPEKVTLKYEGRSSCLECHEKEYTDWSGSHHDLAQDLASKETVLGDFNNNTFIWYEDTNFFYQNDGKFFVNTRDKNGLNQDYEITYVFGVYPLQQYIIEFPGGYFQTLAYCWDSRPKEEGGQRWFHIYDYENEYMEPGDILHWTGLNQNWNFMCVECHTTELKKNYDIETDTYNTTWKVIDVSCENCHGPASQHIAWARADQRGENPSNPDNLYWLVHSVKEDSVQWIFRDNGIAYRETPRKNQMQVELCARCHSRRRQIYDKFEVGHYLMDYYTPQLIDGDFLYHPDGQVKDEVYVYGSFLQSSMYKHDVTCTDCHDQHTLEHHTEGNGICAKCHNPETFDTPSHHFHKMDSIGSSCVECHMSQTLIMQVDARADHSIRIPRPDISIKTGSTNACIKCHPEEGSQWALDNMIEWYGTDFMTPHYGEVIYEAVNRLPGTENKLYGLAFDTSQNIIARASALLHLQNFPSPIAQKAIEKGVTDDEILIRYGAIEAARPYNIQEIYNIIKPAISDSIRSIRITAGELISGHDISSFPESDKNNIKQAVGDFIYSLKLNGDRPLALSRIGIWFMQHQQYDSAEYYFNKALKDYPLADMVYVNLAELERIKGNDDKAIEYIQKGLSENPDREQLNHAMGLYYIRKKDYNNALIYLKKASLNHTDPHYTYVYAIGLNSTGQTEKAVEILEECIHIHPYNTDLLYALATISWDQGSLEDARKYLGRIQKIRPWDESIGEYLKQLGN